MVMAIETDGELASKLENEFSSDRVRVIHSDVLKVDLRELLMASLKDEQAKAPDSHRRVRVVANLPYYISSPILQKLIDAREYISDMTLMLQDEVVDRISSGPGSKDYGYLSVFCQLYCEVQKLFKVAPLSFKPAPEVWSAVARLIVRPQPLVKLDNESRFLLLVRCAFAQRRKTILNNLKAAGDALFSRARLVNGSDAGNVGLAKTGIESALKAAGIDPRRRAETFSIPEFGTLYDALYNASR